MSVASAVLVKVLAALAAWSAVLAFRRSRAVGMGLLVKAARWRQVAVDSLYYPAGLASVAATLALLITSDGWRSVKLAATMGGGSFALLWPLYFLTRAVFAKIAFDAMDSHRSFAERRGLSFAVSGPEYREDSEEEMHQSAAAVRFDQGGWLALVVVVSGSSGERGYSQKTRLELPVRAVVSEPEVWNLEPVDGLLGRALAPHAGALARLGPRVSLIRLDSRRLVVMGAPNRKWQQVAELVEFAEALAASIDELHSARSGALTRTTP